MPLSDDSVARIKQMNEALDKGAYDKDPRAKARARAVIDAQNDDGADLTDAGVSSAYDDIYKKTAPPNTGSLTVAPNAQNNTKQQSTGDPKYSSTTGTSPTVPTTSGTAGSSDHSCSNNLVLDKRLKIFRTHDKVLWFFWVDDLSAYGSSSQGATAYSIIDFRGTQVSTDPLSDEDSVLFFTKTLNDSFELPIDAFGSLNTNVLWSVYYDTDANKFKPIYGVKYFDMYYDHENEVLDVVFWANVDIEDLENGEVVYPDSLVDVHTAAGLNNAQRVVFYTRGKYQSVTSSRTGKATPTGMFLFSKPALLLSPGHSDRSNNDAVVDEAVDFKFLEFN